MQKRHVILAKRRQVAFRKPPTAFRVNVLKEEEREPSAFFYLILLCPMSWKQINFSNCRAISSSLSKRYLCILYTKYTIYNSLNQDTYFFSLKNGKLLCPFFYMKPTRSKRQLLFIKLIPENVSDFTYLTRLTIKS